MYTQKTITIISRRRKRNLLIKQILYIHMRRKHADVYMDNGEVIETRTTYKEFCNMLGDDFIEVRRGSLVSVIAIHNVKDKVYLNNGDAVEYTISRKDEIENRLYQRQRKIIKKFSTKGIPDTFEEYCEYYKSYENMPFAFTDIEMVFDDDCHAVDWVFRYGNQALAKLEKVPLEKLIDNRFGSIFPDMDEKWLRCYERAILFGETLSMDEYSPEIDVQLSIICFPTFEGHCGCILFDACNIHHIRSVRGEDGTTNIVSGKLCE